MPQPGCVPSHWPRPRPSRMPPASWGSPRTPLARWVDEAPDQSALERAHDLAMYPSRAHWRPFHESRPQFWGATVSRKARLSLPPRQGAILQSLLIRHPAFLPPEPPISYRVVASAMGISLSTVKTQLRRVRLRHPELYAAVMAIRAQQFETYHRFVSEARRERSRKWGRRRWIARFRRQYGRSPWE